MWDNLPTEITTIILLKLPVKTLIGCTCLSKSFFSFITSHVFINTHLAQNPNTHFFLRYFTKGKKEEKYHLECGGFQNEGLSMPFDCFDDWFNVVGCVNGVICLVDDFSYEGTLIILWNPSIRKYVHVPEPHYVYESYGQYESACGFGFDSITNDYKVVRVVRLLDREPTETEVEVYSLRSGCWRNVGTGPKYSIKGHYLGYTPCFFNGSVHWVGTYRRSFTKCENVILKFDMSKETFEIMEVPSMLKESLSSYTYVLECKGMLTLIRFNYADNLKTDSVWHMKEYGVVNSWTKMIAFENNDCLSRMPRPNGFRHNGEVIIVKRSGDFWGMSKNVIVSFNPATHGETVLGELAANDIEPLSRYLSTYVESMALFREGKTIDDHTKETVKSN